MAQYVYSMMGVGKVVPPKKHILKDIYLSFFPGAKIGVLGLNGAGKSTLLRIMAGIDTEIEGEAVPQKNLKIGYLPQEPQLDEDSDVRANVEQGLGEAKTLLNEFERVSARFGEELTDDEMTALIEEQGELQTRIDAIGAWEVERKLEIAADALRLPPWEAKVAHLSGGERRRVALCRLLLSEPEMLLLDEPTNHLDAESVAWLERYLEQYAGTVIAVTHDRYFSTTWRAGFLSLTAAKAFPGKVTIPHGSNKKTSDSSRKKKQHQRGAKPSAPNSSGFAQTPKAGKPKVKRGSRDLMILLIRSFSHEAKPTRFIFRPVHASATKSSKLKMFARRLVTNCWLMIFPSRYPRGHRGHHWAEWRGQDDAL